MSRISPDYVLFGYDILIDAIARRALLFPGTARHIVSEAERVGGQVCAEAISVYAGDCYGGRTPPRNDVRNIS